MSSKPSGKGRKLPFPQDTCYRCGKGRHQKVQDCKALDTVCRGCGKKGHFEKVCLKDYTTLRGSREGWKNIENSTNSTAHSPQTVLLKADTGADVNLMNRKTFDQLFGEAKVLQPTPIRMENYGNTAVKVLGMFHVFLRWKDKIYKQLFYVADCDRSPNLLSRDAGKLLVF